ncbi:MAG: fasciclin domain-containing protein [Bacteroidales bacterium]
MKRFLNHRTGKWGCIISMCLMLFGCPAEPVPPPTDDLKLVMSQYVAAYPEKYSEFDKILKRTNLDNLLSVRGPFTLMLPNDEAMQAYYEKMGVSSFEEFTDTMIIYKLVYNHLVMNGIGSGDIGLGALRDTNALGDYLVTEFDGADIIVNKSARIIDRDIRVANGFIHEIDKVIDPVTDDVYTVLSKDPGYSIFAAGLNKTRLKDTLQIISFPFGTRTARTRFTVLAVADTTYARFGINNIDELIARYSSTTNADSLQTLQNGFYRYMEYHCMANTYYLSDFSTKLYPILSYDNNILVDVSNDYKINPDKKTGLYTAFYIPQSNVPSKNGAIHTVNDMLPVVQPAPTKIILETTDYLELKMGDYWGKYYARFTDGQNTFQKIKWEGDYLLYYYKNHDTGDLTSDDCLSMSGFWTCEVTIPKIMKGQYSIASNLWANNIDYVVYIDGVKVATVARATAARIPWCEVNWTKTEEHKIKVVNTTWGMLFWDTIELTPIK